MAAWPLHSSTSASTDWSRVLPSFTFNPWRTSTFIINEQVKTGSERLLLKYQYQPSETHIVHISYPNLVHQLGFHSFRLRRLLSVLLSFCWYLLRFHATFRFSSLNLTQHRSSYLYTTFSCHFPHSTSYSTTSYSSSFSSIPPSSLALSLSLSLPSQVQGHTCSYCSDTIRAPRKHSVKG